MKVTGIVCDQCAGPIAPHARTLSAIFVLTVRNGHDREDSKEFRDLCGEACLHKALGALLRQVEGQ